MLPIIFVVDSNSYIFISKFQGYVGSHCTSICQLNPCDNQGICIQDNGSLKGYFCQCNSSLYSGMLILIYFDQNVLYFIHIYMYVVTIINKIIITTVIMGQFEYQIIFCLVVV